MILTPWPKAAFLDNNGRPLVGGLLFTYEAGTDTKLATYTDSSGLSVNTNPIELDFRGEANVWLDPLLTYKFVLAKRGDTDPPTNPIWTVDNISALGGLTQQIIGQILWPITPAEEAAGFTESTISFVGPQGYIPRYKIIAGDALAASGNTSAFKMLLSPLTAGPEGKIWFPSNEAGNNTWYFNDIVEIRSGVQIDLGNGALHFAKSSQPSDDTYGFLTFIRNVTIENGSIVVDYNGTGGVNAGSVMRIGSRTGYPYGIYTQGIFDEDDLTDNGLEPMGNIVLRELRVQSNNPSVAAVLMLGGLQGIEVENFYLNGQGAVSTGILYEFGYASKNGAPLSQPWLFTSSHANGLEFRNVRVENLDSSVLGGSALELTGAYAANVTNLYGNGVASVFISRPGEALFFNPWAGVDDAGAKRCITLTNIVGENFSVSSSIGISLIGAESASSGYLNGHLPVPAYAYELDLTSFSLNGFAIKGAVIGVRVSGPADIRNGTCIECDNGILIDNECVEFDLDNVRILNSTSIGLRASDGPSPIFTRYKIGSIRNSKVCGSVGIGVALNYTQSVKVENCQLGYSAAYDAGDEGSQTISVNAGSDASGVVCDGNFCTTFGGAVAYSLASGVTADESRGCGILNPSGNVTYAGKWRDVLQTTTVTLTAQTPGNLAVSYTQQTLAYIRSGQRVDYTLRLETSAFSYTTATGTMIVQNLPYTVNSSNFGRSQGALSFRGITKSGYTQFTVESIPGTTQFNVIACGSAVDFATLLITEMPSGGNVALRASGHYFI